MAGTARTHEEKPAARTSAAASKAPASRVPAAGTAARLPTPAVAHAILAGAEKTERVHAKASGRKPPAAHITATAQNPAAPTPAQKLGLPTLTIVPKPVNGVAGHAPIAVAAAGTAAEKAHAPLVMPAARGVQAGAKETAPSAAPAAADADAAAVAPTVSEPRGAAPAGETTATAETATLAASGTDKKGAGEEPGKEQSAEPKPTHEPDAAGAEGAAAASPAAAPLTLTIPEPPAAPSASTMKRIGGVQARAGGAATAQAALPPGATQASAARQAAPQPEAEAKAHAQSDLIAMLGAAPAPSPEIVKLCEHIHDIIHNKRPVDQDALMEAKPDAEAKNAGNQLNATVEGETKKVQSTYGAINNAPAATAPAPGQQLPGQPDAATTAPVDAKAATPDAVAAGNVSLDADVEASRTKIQDAGMDTPTAQLIKTGPVAEARGAQGEFDQAAKEDPAKVLAGQKEVLAKAEGNMAALQQQALAALTTSRAATTKGTSSQQEGMVVSEEAKRIKASADAQQVFSDAQKAVTALLAPVAQNAIDKWEAEKTLLVTTFKADLAPVQEKVNERHKGAGGFVVGLWDVVAGLPKWAEDGYKLAEENFGDGVIKKLKEISAEVNAVIATCELLIKTARDRIAKIFADLGGGLTEWAAQERAKFDGKLDNLQQQAIATRDNFNKDLMDTAKAAVNEVREEIAELRKKAGGLLGRITSAIGRFIDDPVKCIIEGLLEAAGIVASAFWAVVAKIKKVVREIADDPLKFANNLLKGLAEGFGKFFDNFGTHLLKGFLSWLLGGLKDVQIPKEVSVRSIVTFFLQLMGITWPNIRKILVKLVGAKNVALIEKVYSLVSLLIDKGPEGIYEMIKEKLDPQSIVDQVLDMAVDFMVTAIIKQVSVRIIALFNPAGAIFQALEAIYRVLKWIFQNAARIFTLVETVVNGIADILAGNTGGFSTAVEKALGMLIAPVISFIADYLSLGDLPSIVVEKVKSMREWILGMIEKALAWMIEKGKALLAAVGIGKKDDKKKDGKFDGQIGKTVTWTAERHVHKLWIEEAGGGVSVRMASVETDGSKQLDEYDGKAKDLPEEKQKEVLPKITTARGLLAQVQAEAQEVKKEASAPEPPADLSAKDDEVESTEQQLASIIREIQEALGIDPEKAKKEAAADIRKLPPMIESPEELTDALKEIAAKHARLGLKAIAIENAADGFTINAEASPATFADHLTGLLEDGAGGCSIMIQIDGEIVMDPDDEIALTVWNEGNGGAHAEHVLQMNLHLLMNKLYMRHKKYGMPQLLEIWIRYSPCKDQCRGVLGSIEGSIKRDYPNIGIRWYFETLYEGRQSKRTAMKVVREYRKKGIFIMSRAGAVRREKILAAKGE
ncbi:hypothetical protein LJR267_010707 [Paraburkholderia hospita]|uniref:phage tail protein n=1 Tax=Paraburkholderia hospita TaxID=169430 RepID=UPI003ECF6653